MTAAEILFWVLTGVIAYAYLGYGALVVALGRRKGPPSACGDRESPDRYEPATTLLVSAYNEETWLARKIGNSLSLDYPEEKLGIVVVTDGSDDGSAEILRKFPRVRHLHAPVRRGKMAAINRAMKFVDTEIVIFSDANAMLNREAVREIVRCFRDPAVGCVSGEKRISTEGAGGAADSGEGTYWRYESRIKEAEARLGSCVGAAGELFAIRAGLFREEAEDTILDDFTISMRIALRGYRVRYAPAAFAVETASAGIGEEIKRKIRIAAGNLQAVLRMPELLNPFRQGRLAFQYVSHKFLRSFAVPLCFAALIPLNLLLLRKGGVLYPTLLALQGIFYLAAGAGCLLRNRRLSSRLFFVPFYVVVMNLSALAGASRYAAGRQSVLWEKALRKEPSTVGEDGGP